MPLFKYDGFDGAGRPARGEVDAASATEARELLGRDNIRAVSVNAVKTSKNLSFNFPPNQADITVFTRDFAAMLSAGVPISQCMDILARQTRKKSMSRIIGRISGDIMGGTPLAAALKKFPSVFNALYCNMVAAGEASGKLDETMSYLTKHREKAAAMKHRILAAMTYPMAVGLITVAATGLMFGFVVPRFASMFLELGGELPLPTRIIMSISNGCRTWGIPGLLLLAGSIFTALRWSKSNAGALVADRILLSIPLAGSLRRKSAVARFSHTLSTLLKSGVGILEALSIAASTSGSVILHKKTLVALEHIAGGQSIAGPLEESSFFPPMVVQMVSVGEKTGNLSGMFGRIAVIYEEEVEAAVQALTSVLEPLLLVMMALVIGTILIAMYLPMFELMSTIQ